jgi:hypothetical protein
MHDLKNILGQLRLIQGNKNKHLNNPAFINSVFQTLEYNGDKNGDRIPNPEEIGIINL